MEKLKLGEKIIEFRRKNSFTIKDFSRLTGLSPALISNIERNVANPSLSALQAIARALGVTLSTLFIEEIDNQSLILRKEDRIPHVKPNEKHVVYDLLTPNILNSNIEMLLVTLKPHSETYGGFTQHGSEEEIAYVVEGETYIIFEEEEFLLKKEDTIRILPNRKHKFRNATDEEIKILFIKSRVYY